MILLSVIIEYLGPAEIKSYYASLNQIIEGALKSDHRSLKTLGIETVTNFAQSNRSLAVLKKYQNIIPLVLQALNEEDEDSIKKVFETFNELVEVKKVLSPHLFQIIDCALKVATSDNFSNNLREVTMLFLEMVAANYAK
jgi:alpha-mannosidase